MPRVVGLKGERCRRTPADAATGHGCFAQKLDEIFGDGTHEIPRVTRRRLCWKGDGKKLPRVSNDSFRNMAPGQFIGWYGTKPLPKSTPYRGKAYRNNYAHNKRSSHDNSLFRMHKKLSLHGTAPHFIATLVITLHRVGHIVPT